MDFTTKKTTANTIELTIECGREELAQYVRAAETELGRDLELPGFRKGKAPRDVIRQQVGEAKVREMALETAIQRSLGEAVAQGKLDVLEASNLVIKENSPEKLVFTVQVTVFPVVTLPDLATITVARHPVVVENKELDDTLETIRASRAVLTETA